MSGTIRIAAPVAIGQSLLAAIAARVLRDYPELSIEWHLPDDAVDVTAGGYDLWIRAGKVHRDDMVVQHIYQVERLIVAAAEQPEVAHPRELDPMPAVRLVTFVPWEVELTDADGAIHQLRHRAVFTTDNLNAARTAVLEGAGYAVLPIWCVHTLLVQGALVRVCPT